VRILAAPLAATLQATAQQGHALVVLCDVASNPAEVISTLAEEAPLKDLVRFTHVVSVVQPMAAYPWSSARHPLLLSRVHRGYVTNVVVQDYRAPEGARSEQGEELSTLLLRELEACRSGKRELLARPPTATIADGVRESPGLSRPRQLLARPETAGALACTQPQAKLCCIFVPAPCALDMVTLQAYCHERLQSAAGTSTSHLRSSPTLVEASNPWEGLLCVEAHVRGLAPSVASGLDALAPAEMLAALRSGAAETAQRLVLSPRGSLRAPAQLGAPLATAFGVLWWWCVPTSAGEAVHLRAQRLQAEAAAVVEACRLQPPGLRPAWTSTTDVPAEQVALETEKLLEAEGGLPEGYFFNGFSYIDVDGRESKEHPHLQARLEAVATSHNAEAQAWNAAVAEASQLPLFQPHPLAN